MIKELPKNFCLVDTQIEKNEGWTIKYYFEDKYITENVIYFIQTDDDLEEKNFLNGRKMQQNKYYIETVEGFNIICWLENDISIFLKSNISKDVLESIVEKVISYYDVNLNYQF